MDKLQEAQELEKKAQQLRQEAREEERKNEFFEELPKDYVRDPNMRLDAIKRSITPQGFAKAFFKANI